jgi:hypothetical protein
MNYCLLATSVGVGRSFALPRPAPVQAASVSMVRAAGWFLESANSCRR